MTRNSTGKILSTTAPTADVKTTFGDILIFVLLFFFDVFLLFTTRIPLSIFRWLTTMVVRGYIIYMFICNQTEFFNYFAMSGIDNVKYAIHDIVFILPVYLFCLWYFFTTLIMFLAAFYTSFGHRDINSTNTGVFSEIDNFKNWRNNKMRFSSYEEATQLMRDSAVINNLDQNDPEARNVLSYINNKMRFTSYPGALKFLRGDK